MMRNLLLFTLLLGVGGCFSDEETSSTPGSESIWDAGHQKIEKWHCHCRAGCKEFCGQECEMNAVAYTHGCVCYKMLDDSSCFARDEAYE